MTFTRHCLRFHVTTHKAGNFRYCFVRLGQIVKSYCWRVGTVRSDRIESVAVTKFIQSLKGNVKCTN